MTESKAPDHRLETANRPTLPASCPACGTPVPGGDVRFCPACGHPIHPSGRAELERADPLIGRVIADRYRIDAFLGRGGMGVVYKVEHVHIGKLMAMKLLHGELARDQDIQKRFRREAEAASRLNHHNTVQIFDFGWDGGLMYLVMEFVDGRDFGLVIQNEGPLPFPRVARLAAQVAQSVSQAHGAGVIHRDLKPENMMLVQRPDRELMKVLDFGLAKLRHQDKSITLTRAGSIVGTPYYMAPEHIRGDPVDGRADVYALGAVMYKALTSNPPFVASSPMGVLTKHLTDPVVPPSVRVSTVPPEADAIVLRAMAKKLEDRYQSMDELHADLVAYLTSIGEVFRDAVSSSSLTSPSRSVSGKRPAVSVATRDDVDLYERSLRRRGLTGRAALFAFVAAVVALGYFGYRHLEFKPAPGPGVEVEPNNGPDSAQPLPLGRPFRGKLGQRQNVDLGDADVWRLDNPGGETRPIAFEVTALPNIDLAVDLVKAGVDAPVLTVDNGGVGEPEAVPNFPVRGSLYFLRVREVGVVGVMPTENVSDEYTVSWTFAETGVGEETEMNDSLELADEIRPGQPVTGYLGWAGDVDVYCVPGALDRVVGRVTGVEAVDLVLRSVDRGAARSRRYDVGQVGEGEVTRPLRGAGLGEACFEVSASRRAGARRASSRSTYTLTVEVAPPSADGGVEAL